MRPPIPEPPYRGGCLCGAVRYRFDARPWALNACHCTDCKKLTGATNLLMVLGAREAFSAPLHVLLSGERNEGDRKGRPYGLRRAMRISPSRPVWGALLTAPPSRASCIAP